MSSFPLLSGFQLPFLLFSIWIYLVWQCNELLSFKNIINRDHTVVKSFTNSCLYFLLAVETQPSCSLGYFNRMFSKEISNLWKANYGACYNFFHSVHNEPYSKFWHCQRCTSSTTVLLRRLLNHYYTAHRNEVNFYVKCNVQNCQLCCIPYLLCPSNEKKWFHSKTSSV